MKENDLRDFLFENYKTGISELITSGKRGPIISRHNFRKISELLKTRTETKIDEMIARLNLLTLNGNEVRLVRDGDSTTRIDLLGKIEEYGDLVIIELKKSKQTERQSFTELLAYANHFCTLFPSLSETSFMSVLVAPMEGRGVRDALAQELIGNDKNILGLIPDFQGGTVSLEPFYPSDLYYRWIENSIIGDQAFTVVTAAFPLIDGWIDAGPCGSSLPPEYTQKAFNIMTSLIAQKVEALGLHGFVYARQYWTETCPAFQNPNTIILCLLNPFSTFRADMYDGEVFGNSDDTRINDLQGLINQLEDPENWFENLSSSFQGQAIRLVQDSFKEFFDNNSDVVVRPEISLPDWKSFKTNLIEAAICHNTDIRVIGLLRTIYAEYMRHCREKKIDEIFYHDDLPKFGYLDHENFLAIWEIISGLSNVDDETDG